MTYDCSDVQSLLIANVEEPKGITVIAEPCDYGIAWLIDLIDKNGWCITEKYTPVAGIPDEPHQNIIETIRVAYTGRNEEVVKARRKLDEFLCEIMRWHIRQSTNNSIWLYHFISGESGYRRSLLYGVTPVDDVAAIDNGGSTTVLNTRLAVERHWCWETPESIQGLFGIRTVWGDVINPDYEMGTANGRLCRFATKDEATKFTADGDIISKIWIGIKEDAGCGLDEWAPAMDLLLGFTGFTDSNTTPGISLGEPAMIEDFSLSTARIKRIGIELFQAFPGANYDQWRGSYIVLMRCRVDTSTTSVTVQADSGWRTTRLKDTIGSPVVIDGADGTDYRLVQLGIANIPEDMHRLCANDPLFDNLDNHSIGILASREAGNGKLAMTDLYLIPYEHSAVITNLNPDTEFINFEAMWFSVINNEDDTGQLRAYTQRIIPDDEFLISPDNDYAVDLNDFSLPKQGSRIVAAINVYDQDGNNIIHQKDFEWLPAFDVFPRWLSLRHDN